MVPDVALLRIFDFYLDEARKNTWHLGKAWTNAWHPLVHVCRKWRIVAFGSPRRLNLLLHCTASTPVRETLDAWPPLLIVVQGNGHKFWGVNNIVAALEHNDRIYAIDLLYLRSRMLEKVLRRCSGHSRNSHVWTSRPRRRSSPLRSWADPHPVCKNSGSVTFYFQDCPISFCLPPTWFIFLFGKFLIVGTFHPGRWSLASPC
jgi:hypothetical protein